MAIKVKWADMKVSMSNQDPENIWGRYRRNFPKLEKALPALFRPLSLANPEDQVTVMEGLDSEGSRMVLSNNITDDGTGMVTKPCVFFRGVYGENSKLDSINRMPVILEIYRDGALLKTETIIRSESDEDFWEEAYGKKICYDEEPWPLERISGKLIWKESQGYSGGSKAAEVSGG